MTALHCGSAYFSASNSRIFWVARRKSNLDEGDLENEEKNKKNKKNKIKDVKTVLADEVIMDANNKLKIFNCQHKVFFDNKNIITNYVKNSIIS